MNCNCLCHEGGLSVPHPGEPCPGKRLRLIERGIDPDNPGPYDPVKAGFKRMVRDAVFERDGDKCRYCGIETIAWPGRGHVHHQRTLDHVVPRALGGRTSIENCVTACHGCNQKKKNRTPEQSGFYPIMLDSPELEKLKEALV